MYNEFADDCTIFIEFTQKSIFGLGKFIDFSNLLGIGEERLIEIWLWKS